MPLYDAHNLKLRTLILDIHGPQQRRRQVLAQPRNEGDHVCSIELQPSIRERKRADRPLEVAREASLCLSAGMCHGQMRLHFDGDATMLCLDSEAQLLRRALAARREHGVFGGASVGGGASLGKHNRERSTCLIVCHSDGAVAYVDRQAFTLEFASCSHSPLVIRHILPRAVGVKRLAALVLGIFRQEALTLGGGLTGGGLGV